MPNGMTRFFLVERLYAGRFSVVHRGRYFDKDVVIKRCCDSKHARREFRAIWDLTQHGCRNIAGLEMDRLVGDDEIENCKQVHEYYAQGYDHPSNLLLTLYKDKPPMCDSDEDISRVMRDVLEGVADMHRLGWVHCDVKRENILFDGDRYRLIDFGLAIEKHCARDHRYLRGTPFYLAPEIVQHGEISPMVDMYAIGVLMYSLLHYGDHPIEALNHVAGGRACQRVIAETSYDPARWTNDDAPLSKEVCSRLLHKYPPARMTALEALDHPLFSSIVHR